MNDSRTDRWKKKKKKKPNSKQTRENSLRVLILADSAILLQESEAVEKKVKFIAKKDERKAGARAAGRKRCGGEGAGGPGRSDPPFAAQDNTAPF